MTQTVANIIAIRVGPHPHALVRSLRSLGRSRYCLAIICAATVACASHDEVPTAHVDRPASSASRPAAARPRIVVLGDSLTAGLGLAKEDAYPALLQQRLNEEGLNYEVVNAGVSGDTSAGGLSRLDWALDGDVRVLIVALGGNDGLRGLPPAELKSNLARIIERAQARGIAVVLAGMEAPPNFGREYVTEFHQVYPALARQYHAALVPFLLDGVAGNQMLNQRDGIHPTERGARIVADNVWSVLKPTLSHSEGQSGRD
jgi:acyl-CoA thioesterase-1